MKSVVLLSGGIDSATALHLCARAKDEVVGLSIAYGQSHRVELRFAKHLCDRLQVEYEEIWVPEGLLKGGAIFGVAEMPHLTYQEIAEGKGPSPTYVPFRNGTMISLAAAHALKIEADQVVIAAHAEDARGWAYPDCTPEFLGAMAAAVYVGTYHRVRLVAPFQFVTKADIILTGHTVGVPFELTWSCYDPQKVKDIFYHCGKCPTCVARRHAFKEAQLLDPTQYMAVPAL